MKKPSSAAAHHEPKPLRADAKRNWQRLVSAAEAAFAEHGIVASLEDIARHAGVGIGTLYRHFPSRDALLAALMRGEMESLVTRANAQLAAPDPGEALTAWLRAFLRHARTYRGLAEYLAISQHTGGSEFSDMCELTCSAVAKLVARAKEAGALRKDVRPDDVLSAVSAIAWASEQSPGDPKLAERLFALFLDALKPPCSHAGARRAPARTRH